MYEEEMRCTYMIRNIVIVYHSVDLFFAERCENKRSIGKNVCVWYFPVLTISFYIYLIGYHLSEA